MIYSSRFKTWLDPVTRGWAVIFSGNVVRMALGFIASVLLARSLGPAAFGIFASLSAVVSITSAFSDFGLTASAVKHIAAVQEENPKLAQTRGTVFVWLRLLLTGAVILGGILLSGILTTLLDIPQGQILLPLAFIGVLATALSGIVSALFQAIGRFDRVTLMTIFNTILTVILTLLLAWQKQLNLITALAILGIGTSLVTWLIGWRLLPLEWHPRLPARVIFQTESRRMLEFGRWLWFSNTLATLTASLDILLMKRWEVLTTLGAYGLALNLVAKVDVINHSLFMVLVPTVSALTNQSAIKSYIKRSLARSGLISLGLLCLLPLAPAFITIFYGPEFAQAIPLFQALIVVVIFDILATPLLLLVFPLDQPRLLSLAELIRIAVLFPMAAWLIPTWGAWGAITARFTAKVVGVVITMILLSRQSRRP